MKRFYLTTGLIVFFSFFITEAFSQFTPGEGGALPPKPTFTATPNTVPGLYVSSVQRKNNYFYSGTHNEVDMNFPAPSEYGADSYTLQSYNNTTQQWENFIYQSEQVTTTGDNFSLTTDIPISFRLLLVGGDKNGWVSNQVFAPVSGVDTYFSGWGLDESMMITGIMWPNIGRGLEASFFVKKLSDGTEVTNALNYQWYRVNPATYEFTAISGANELKYVTTEADAGYSLCIKAEGDGTNAGGFTQVISGGSNIHQVIAFVSNVTTAGFTLNLYKSVSEIDPSYFQLVDKDYIEVPITAIENGANAAIYNFKAALDPENAPYTLTNNWETSTYWHVASKFVMQEFEMIESMITIDFTTSVSNISDLKLQIYPQPASDQFNYKFDADINKIRIFNVNGEMINELSAMNREGSVNTQKLTPGIYFVKFTTNKGIICKKLLIEK